MSLQQLSSLVILLLLVAIGYLVWSDSNNPIDENEINELVLDYHDDNIPIMNPSELNQMIKGYRERQLVAIESDSMINNTWNQIDGDALSVNFDIEKLKKLIYHTEMNVKSNFGKEDHPELGIRFYYAAYSADHPEYSNRHTLVMVPTYKNNQNDFVDFNANNPVIDVNTEYTDILSNDLNDYVSAVNRGTLVPPM